MTSAFSFILMMILHGQISHVQYFEYKSFKTCEEARQIVGMNMNERVKKPHFFIISHTCFKVPVYEKDKA